VALTLTDEQETSLREALGLAEDADAEAFVTAIEDLATAPPAEAPAATAAASRLPDGVVTVEASVLAELRSNAARGAEARAQQESDAREAVVSDAVKAGKIPVSKKAAWLKTIEADPSMSEVLASLEPGLIPVSAIGHGVEASAADQGDLGWFGATTTTKEA
jgi:hypothetical protein